MTDNDIIKVLECIAYRDVPCKDCVLSKEMYIYPACQRIAANEAVDLIKRQQAKIEVFNNNISAMATTMSNSAKATRHEAIKAFAILHRELMLAFRDDDDQISLKVCEYDANTDNLVKEMIGEYKERGWANDGGNTGEQNG